MTGRCLVSVRFYLVYRVGLVDKIFGLVDLVNKALGLVNKPKWHFEMACILLMPCQARLKQVDSQVVDVRHAQSDTNKVMPGEHLEFLCHMHGKKLLEDKTTLQDMQKKTDETIRRWLLRQQDTPLLHQIGRAHV